MAKKSRGGSKGKLTGRIRHKGMGSLLDGPGGRDPHADASHHAANKKHGMDDGLMVRGGSGSQSGPGNQDDNDGDEC